MPIFKGISFCVNVWKGSHHPDSQVVGAKAEVLRRERHWCKHEHVTENSTPWLQKNIRRAHKKTTPTGNPTYETAGQRFSTGKRSRIGSV